ncbi:MAG: Hdr-like menaquinol oxidoreductase cytochrome c subunit [Bradyrhizobium sp.]|uniref:hypothetical protein n=1 Tax=Bradyrhizobium sp. TaxID=376 RepID=UPI0025BBE0C0|nr:hypothetical protein [Bradyrhizobium sp.]MBI5263328.1 Hdr-like menaquinol oxidoreductase cytochrome c subunit [Bradyrhizobium sp.]
MRRRAAIALGLFMGVAVLAAAGMRASAESGTLAPQPPKGRGEHCVADTDFMRRNHMKMLLGHRSEAVRLGVRTQQYDLNGCVDCHAVAGADGRPVSFDSPQHFCRSCHTYAAVSIDCFECHASRPQAPGKAAAVQPGDKEVAAISQYLRDVGQ